MFSGGASTSVGRGAADQEGEARQGAKGREGTTRSDEEGTAGSCQAAGFFGVSSSTYNA